MGASFMLPLRVAQGLIAFLNLVLLSYAASHWGGAIWRGPSPSEINFMIFNSVWTLLAVAYLVIAPLKFPDAAHKFAILGVEALTMIFWFAGWIALAVLLGEIGIQGWTVGRVSAAGTAFGAIEWLLFVGTCIMAALHCHRTRNTHSGKHDPAMEVDARV